MLPVARTRDEIGCEECKADSDTFESSLLTQTLLSEHRYQALRVFGSDSRSRPRFEIGLAYPGLGDDTLLVEQRGCLTPRLSDE